MSRGSLVRRTKTAWKYADAQARLDELKAERDGGIVPTGKQTVEKYLRWWIDKGLVDVEPATRDSYKRAIEGHAIPRIGALHLSQITPADIKAWLARMAEEEVGSRTRQNAFKVLKIALRMAVELSLIAKHPCERVAAPKHESEPIQPFTLEEAKILIKAADGTRWNALVILALTTGMRIGELLGLEWKKINWKKRSLFVDQQASEIGGRVVLKKPKSKASIRHIGLTPGAIAALKAHRAILHLEGNGESPMVFPAPEGGVSGRGNVRTRFWNPLLVSLAIEERGIHHTRHTYATHALLAGVHPLVVSKNLGHSKPSVTLDIYGHVLKEAETASTDTIARLFG